MPVLKKLP